MFNKEDMMVSALVAENMVYNKEKEYKNKIKEMTAVHSDLINSMKANSRLTGVLSIRNTHFSFGQPTGIYSNGIQLYTGDEVAFQNGYGKKGIIVERGEELYVYTNAEIAKLITVEKLKEKSRIFARHEGYATGEHLTITKHYNELKLGDEIAKGRKGASGFVVTELSFQMEDK